MNEARTHERIRKANLSFSGCDMVPSVTIRMPDGEIISKVIGSLQTLTYSIHQDKRPIRSVGNINAKDYVFGPRTIAGTLIFSVFNKHFTREIFEEVRKTDPGRLEDYHFIADEMPPFEITVSFANEYGVTARMALYGVRILNEGMTLSINDIYTENTYQFVATDIDYIDGEPQWEEDPPDPEPEPEPEDPPERVQSDDTEDTGSDDEMIRIRDYMTRTAHDPDAFIEWVPRDVYDWAPQGMARFTARDKRLIVLIGQPEVYIEDMVTGEMRTEEVETDLRHFEDEGVWRTMAPRSFIDDIFGYG